VIEGNQNSVNHKGFGMLLTCETSALTIQDKTSSVWDGSNQFVQIIGTEISQNTSKHQFTKYNRYFGDNFVCKIFKRNIHSLNQNRTPKRILNTVMSAKQVHNNQKLENMRTTSKLNIALSLMAFLAFSVGAFAQPADFQQHGNNSSGTPAASENIDSVTVGASMRYVVEPDATANPAYDFATMTGTLNSIFNWTVDAAVGTISGAPDDDNDITVTVAGAAGTGQIIVKEVSSAGCASGDSTTIDVAVIAAPSAEFTTTTGDTCIADTSTIGYTLPVTLSSDVASGNIRINVNVDGPSTADIYDQDWDLADTDTEFTLPAGTFDDGLGSYTITIEEVTDRISRKSSVAGTITTATHTLTINRVPNTGVIYHLPNQ